MPKNGAFLNNNKQSLNNCAKFLGSGTYFEMPE